MSKQKEMEIDYSLGFEVCHKKVATFGDESSYFVVGIHEDKEEFIKDAQEWENSIIIGSIKKGYLYGEINGEKSLFSIKEKPQYIKKYGEQRECFYVRDDDLESID